MNTENRNAILVAVAIILFILFLFTRKQPKIMSEDTTLNSMQETSKTTPVTPATNPTPVAEATASKPSVSAKYEVTLNTSKGEIVIALNQGQTPNTVANFVTLAQKGFYNNTVFHRAIKGFMIQGGDPTGTGSGGPGYKFDDERFNDEYTRGAVAMANAGPNTNGSQFFIMHADYPLPKNYTIFGHVVKGIEVVDAIATDKVTLSPSGEMSKPVDPTKIITATVAEAK